MEQIQKRIVEIKLERVGIVSRIFFSIINGWKDMGQQGACEFKRNLSRSTPPPPPPKCKTEEHIYAYAHGNNPVEGKN